MKHLVDYLTESITINEKLFEYFKYTIKTIDDLYKDLTTKINDDGVEKHKSSVKFFIDKTSQNEDVIKLINKITSEKTEITGIDFNDDMTKRKTVTICKCKYRKYSYTNIDIITNNTKENDLGIVFIDNLNSVDITKLCALKNIVVVIDSSIKKKFEEQKSILKDNPTIDIVVTKNIIKK